MKITIPNNNLKERNYILTTLFVDFLGIDFILDVDDHCSDWLIHINQKCLRVSDAFFNDYKQDLSYLKLENLPKKVKFVSNQFIVENDIPVLYGNDKLELKENEIFCGIDIFASIFFMLTRWEEYVNNNRDNHNRFPATESIAFRNGFLDRPIVNEYLEMLWNILIHLGFTQSRKENKFQIHLTHDVDHIYFYKNWKQVFKMALADLLKRNNAGKALERISEYFLVKRNKINDPHDTFDWLMDKSDSIGVKSNFYFMSGGVTEYDNNYCIDEPKAIELIEKIKKRGHLVGFHPSYDAYNNIEQFTKEKNALNKVSNITTQEGREHYLRFEVPTTWQIWEDNDMSIDSTCGYADKIGFRCGTGNDFKVFNIISRKKLKLIERPLIVMECSIICSGSSYNNEDTQKKILVLKEKCNKYQTNFTLLWHNSFFLNKEHNDMYVNILKK